MNTVFSFSVYVDNTALPEYEVDGKTYIEADLHAKSSYIIKDIDEEGYIQNYPVTPFTIFGSFRNRFKHPCYLKLSVDGQQIWMKPFAPSPHVQNFSVSGIKDIREGVIKELLFSLPKITSQKDEISKSFGTITLECLEAVEDGYFQRMHRAFRCVQKPTVLSNRNIHHQATKHNSGGIGVSTREGREIGNFSNTDRMVYMKRYKLGKENFGKLVLNYRPRHILEELGIIDKKWIEKDKAVENLNSADKEKNKAVTSNKQQKDGSSEVSSHSAMDDAKEIKKESSQEDVLLAKEKENVQPVVQQQQKDVASDVSKDTEMNDIEEFKNRLQAKTKPVKQQDSTQGIKEEPMDIRQMKVDSVMSKFRSLACSDQMKLYCFSPSSRKVKQEQLDREPLDNIKLGCQSPSDINKNIFNEKLACYSPTDKNAPNQLESCQIKKEKIDDVEKQFRYIEIDNDLIMLEEVDEDVVWMGDESCCFIDVEPEEEPVIDLVA